MYVCLYVLVYANTQNPTCDYTHEFIAMHTGLHQYSAAAPVQWI